MTRQSASPSKVRRRRPDLAVALALAAVLAAGPALARGRPMDESIEWLTADCAAVVAGSFLPPQPGAHWQARDETPIFCVERVLKGPQFPQFIQLDRETAQFRAEFLNAAYGGHPCVLFIAAVSPDPPRGVAWLHYRFRLRQATGFLVLDAPDAQDQDSQKKHPAEPRPLCYSMDLSLLRRNGAVLEAIESAAAVPASPEGLASMWLDAPRSGGTPGYAPHPWQLRVPRDARLERLGRRWTRDPARPDLALKVLEAFGRSDENVAVVRTLLADPSAIRRGAGKATWVYYPQRERASRLLRRWGVDMPRTVIEAPREAYRPLGRRPLWLLGAVAAVPLAAAVLPLRRKGGTRLSRRFRCACGVAAVLAVAAVALAVLGSRSRSRVDEVTFSIGGARHWVTSFDGSVQWVFIRGWNGLDLTGDATGGAYGTFPLGGPLDGLWKDDPQLVTSRSAKWGFEAVHGAMLDPTRALRPYRRVTVPTAAVIAVVAGFPLLCVWLPARGSLRRRARRRRGQCLACGYDLRGSRHDERCPECGEPSVGR